MQAKQEAGTAPPAIRAFPARAYPILLAALGVAAIGAVVARRRNNRPHIARAGRGTGHDPTTTDSLFDDV